MLDKFKRQKNKPTKRKAKPNDEDKYQIKRRIHKDDTIEFNRSITRPTSAILSERRDEKMDLDTIPPEPRDEKMDVDDDKKDKKKEGK